MAAGLDHWPRTRPSRRGSANGSRQVCSERRRREGAGRAGSALRTRRRGACAAHAVGGLDRSRRKENKKTNQSQAAAPRFFAKKSWVELRAGRGSRIPQGRLRPPSAPGPRRLPPAGFTPLWARRGIEAKRATRPSGTSRLRSSVVNKVWPPPPRWFAS